MQNKFEENIINIYGEQGKSWLQNISNAAHEIAIKWGLSELRAFSNLSYNYVVSGYRGEQPIVLKLGLDVEALQREAKALKVYSGHGGIEVLLEMRGVLLLEHAIPGDSLKNYFPKKDLQSIEIAASLMQKLHQAPVKQSFPHLKDWLKALDKDVDIPLDILEKARGLRDELLRTSDKEVLLHGDLHHDNIIQKGKDWVAIDPKGVIGDPVFEIAAFIMNPIPELDDYIDASSIVENRIIRFSSLLNIDANRIRDWLFVKKILCSIWAIEDGLEQKHFSTKD
jgi:streptomycin 6-kinase